MSQPDSVPSLSESRRTWFVFWERDDQYALTAASGSLDEREVSACSITADSEDQAILGVLGGRGTMQDAYRVWAVPASEVRPRPFTVNARTVYEDALGEPYIR